MRSKIYKNKKELVDELLESGFSDVNKNQVAFVFGAGLSKALFGMPSWNKLISDFNDKIIGKNIGALNSENIKNNFDPTILAEYISEVHKKVKEKENLNGEFGSFNNGVLDQLGETTHDNKYDPLVKYLKILDSLIITSNYRIGGGVDKERYILDEDKLENADVIRSTLYVHGYDESKLIFTKKQYRDLYNNPNKIKGNEYTSNIKKILIFGVSGRDYDFLNYINQMFPNANKEIIIFDKYYDHEMELISDMFNKLYGLRTYFANSNSFDSLDFLYELISKITAREANTTPHTKAYGALNFMVNKYKSVENRIELFVNETKKVKGWTYNIVSKVILESFENVQFNEIKSAQIDSFFKSTIYQKMLENEMFSNELLDYLGGTPNNRISYRVDYNKILTYMDKNDVEDLVKLNIIVQWMKSIKKIKPIQYINYLKLYRKTFKKNYLIHKYDIEINIDFQKNEIINFLKDVSPYLMNLSLDVLNYRNHKFGFVRSFVNQMSSFSWEEKEAKELAKKIDLIKFKVETGHEDDFNHMWWLVVNFFAEKGLVEYIDDYANDLNIGRIFKYSEYFLYRKFKKMKFRKKSLVPIDEMYVMPLKYATLGIKLKDKKWLDKYKKLLLEERNNNDETMKILEIMSTLDEKAIDDYFSKLIPSWSSRTMGDGQLDPNEKTYEGLKSNNFSEIFFSFSSWQKKKEIITDNKLISLFKMIENVDNNNFKNTLNHFKKDKIPDNILLENFMNSEEKIKITNLNIILSKYNKKIEDRLIKTEEPFTIFRPYSFEKKIKNLLMEPIDDGKYSEKIAEQNIKFLKDSFGKQSDSVMALLLVRFAYETNSAFIEKVPRNELGYKMLYLAMNHIRIYNQSKNDRIFEMLIEFQDNGIDVKWDHFIYQYLYKTKFTPIYDNKLLEKITSLALSKDYKHNKELLKQYENRHFELRDLSESDLNYEDIENHILKSLKNIIDSNVYIGEWERKMIYKIEDKYPKISEKSEYKSHLIDIAKKWKYDDMTEEYNDTMAFETFRGIIVR